MSISKNSISRNQLSESIYNHGSMKNVSNINFVHNHKQARPNMVRSILGDETGKVPVWFMRQAGRYLPEYLAIRSKFPSFIDFCLNAEVAIEASLQPLERFDIDAAIIFSDILVIAHALGANVKFIENIGPKVIMDKGLQKNTDRYHKTIDGVSEVVRGVRQALAPSKAVIGFAGAPWTVASYLLEGGSSKDFAQAKSSAFDGQIDDLINTLTDATIEYLSIQIEAGASIIKLFDSWAGVLNPSLLQKYVIEPTRMIVRHLKERYPYIPIIGFPKGIGVNYKMYTELTGIDCLALDSNTPILWARNNIQGKIAGKVAIQGNLDNSLLLIDDKKRIEKEVLMILDNVDITKNFVFNLGHGVLQRSRIENIHIVIETIRSYEREHCTI